MLLDGVSLQHHGRRDRSDRKEATKPLGIPSGTAVNSPIEDALRSRQGVCQDFAHIMIALVRNARIPCRYVSGYLYHSTENWASCGGRRNSCMGRSPAPRAEWSQFLDETQQSQWAEAQQQQ